LIKTHEAISRQVKGLDFEALLEGFNPNQFALFDHTKAVIDGQLIDKPKTFLANSVADYEGHLVATFFYDFLPQSLDLATGLIVHEMFHAYQFGQKDYTTLLEGHSEQAGTFYDYKSMNLTLKYNEVMWLIKAYEKNDRQAYGHFLAIRQQRKDQYPQGVLYEEATELIEGAATYVELQTIRQLNQDLFCKQVKETLDALKSYDAYFAIRELSYQVGALIMLTLDRFKIDLKPAIEGEVFLSDLYDYEAQDLEIESYTDLERLVVEKEKAKNLALEDFFNEAHHELSFDGLLGYNPMGLLRSGNRVLVKFLVMIQVGGEEVSVNGTFCLIYDDQGRCERIYKAGPKA